ncbi:MAG: hemolysin family protein [Planctomycetota bacterium]
MTVGDYLLMNLPALAGLGVLLVGSGFFSGSETALFSLSRVQMLRFSESHHRGGHAVHWLLQRPHRLLMVILLGNQLVNVAFFAVATALIVNAQDVTALRPYRGVLAAVPLVGVILLGEVAPKNLALSAPAAFSRTVALPLALLVRVLGPVTVAFGVWVIDPLTRLFTPSEAAPPALRPGELTELLEMSARRGGITPDESAWLQEVICLSRRRIRQIMTPRVDIVAYDVGQPASGLIELFRRTGLVKIPVYRGDLDHTLGLVYAKELLLSPSTPLADLARPVLYVPEAGTVDKLLVQFRHAGVQMAIVVDEYGGTAGLVTLEDALEEIVGDLADEGEQVAEPVRQVGPNDYLVRGDLAIHGWPNVFGVDLPAERISTIAGLVMSLLGRVPAVGDEVRTRNLHLTVEAMRGMRVRLVRLRIESEGPS